MLSRTASSLYWMSRYIERMPRTPPAMLDVTYRMSLRTKEPRLQDQEWFAPLNITGTLFPFSSRHTTVCAKDVLHFLALDPDNPSSIFSCLRARPGRTPAPVRGASPPKCGRTSTPPGSRCRAVDERHELGRHLAFFDWVKERSHLFRGVTFGTMLRDEAYHFIRLGTHIERADNTARILDVKYHVLLPSVRDVGGAVDYYQWGALLRSVSAFESYRKVYRDAITPLEVAELLVLRDDVPRSLHFCMNAR
jgi:uncharacterized alpha-E superfamily protein